MLNRTDLFTKPEVKKAIAEIRGALRAALPDGSFGEREAFALAINNEALREELQTMSDGFGAEVLVNGKAYKLHERGTDTYHVRAARSPAAELPNDRSAQWADRDRAGACGRTGRGRDACIGL